MFLNTIIGIVALRSFFMLIFTWRNYATTPRRAPHFLAHLVFSAADVLIVFWAVAYIIGAGF